jgi:hypothetical protein
MKRLLTFEDTIAVGSSLSKERITEGGTKSKR